MPIYEFFCSDCQDTFEQQRSIAEREDIPDCPTCGGSQARRVISMFTAFAGQGASRRAVAGSSTCGSCTPSPRGCAGCGFK